MKEKKLRKLVYKTIDVTIEKMPKKKEMKFRSKISRIRNGDDISGITSEFQETILSLAPLELRKKLEAQDPEGVADIFGEVVFELSLSYRGFTF